MLETEQKSEKHNYIRKQEKELETSEIWGKEHLYIKIE